jgi:hypothetical protein
MIFNLRFLITPLVAIAALGSVWAEHPDLLRLTDGELEGRFGGLLDDGSLSWERDDGIAPLRFQTDHVQQIILRDSEFIPVAEPTAFVELVNGDRLAATVTSLDAEQVVLQSHFAGPLVVPRDKIRGLHPNPFGGRLLYAGPFDAAAWRISAGHGADDAENEDSEKEEEEPSDDTEKPDAWKHHGGHWYHHEGQEALLLDPSLPTSSVIRFQLDWRGTPSTQIAFYADFSAPPEQEDEDGKNNENRRNSYTEFFGNALVIKLRSSYMNLYHVGYEDDGSPFSRVIRGNRAGSSLRNASKAEFELRTNLEEGFAALYVDGDFWGQWALPSEAESIAKLGTGIGFRVEDQDGPVRVGDIIVAEWNGMTDSARSLENRQRDIVLLTNGTDRFSGKVRKIDGETLTLEGEYAPLDVPLADVAEIRFATDTLATSEAESGDQVRLHFQPVGKLTGKPVNADKQKMRVKSSILGELTVDLGTARIIEFREGGSFLDVWNEDF